MLCLAGCQTPVPDGPGKEKLEEMNALAREIPLHPSFRKVDQYSGAKVETAFVDFGFKSNAQYEDIKSFYISELAKKDWKLVADEGVRTGFLISEANPFFFERVISI
jgi:hypothetical protein